MSESAQNTASEANEGGRVDDVEINDGDSPGRHDEQPGHNNKGGWTGESD